MYSTVCILSRSSLDRRFRRLEQQRHAHWAEISMLLKQLPFSVTRIVSRITAFTLEVVYEERA